MPGKEREGERERKRDGATVINVVAPICGANGEVTTDKIVDVAMMSRSIASFFLLRERVYKPSSMKTREE